MKTHPPSFYLAWVLGGVLIAIGYDLVFVDRVPDLFDENHSLEMLSALILLGTAVLWWLSRADAGDGRNWHIPMLLTLMGLRELDWDVHFTSSGLLQLRLYSGDSALWEKLLGAAVIVLILIGAYRLLRYNLLPWMRGLTKGSVISWLVAFSGVALIVSKTLDGLGRKLAGLGIIIDSETSLRTTRLEEMLELAMAIALLQAVIYYIKRPDRKNA